MGDLWRISNKLGFMGITWDNNESYGGTLISNSQWEDFLWDEAGIFGRSLQ